MDGKLDRGHKYTSTSEEGPAHFYTLFCSPFLQQSNGWDKNGSLKESVSGLCEAVELHIKQHGPSRGVVIVQKC